MSKKDIIPLGLVLAMFAIGFLVQNEVPEVMVTHWNAQGQADGYGGKFIGLYLIPIMTLLILGFFHAIPKIEVLDFRKNILDFEKHFYGLRLTLTAFMLIVYVTTISINLGYDIPINKIIMPAVGALIFYMGYIMQFVKRNFWIGVRTPWTITSDKVWDKTHILASKLFRIMGALFIIASLTTEKVVGILIAFILVTTMFIIIYSYWIYRREVEGGKDG
ncbi:MAG: SdpI family protein [Methanobacteriota archaeon]